MFGFDYDGEAINTRPLIVEVSGGIVEVECCVPGCTNRVKTTDDCADCTPCAECHDLYYEASSGIYARYLSEDGEHMELDGVDEDVLYEAVAVITDAYQLLAHSPLGVGVIRRCSCGAQLADELDAEAPRTRQE